MRFASEMRVQLNTGAFGLGLSAAGTNRFLFAVDGEQTSANFTVNVSAGLVNGAAFASVVEAAITTGTGGSATYRS